MRRQSVWKFPVGQPVDVPIFGSVLHVGCDPQGEVCVWIRVFPDNQTESREFGIVGTGHPVEEKWKHHGSFVDGSFVWHVFEAPLSHWVGEP